MPRLPQLLALSCLGSFAVLLGGRALLRSLAAPTPLSSSASLERSRRWSPDPWHRREASLLLHARSQDPQRRQQLLAGQGWGSDPLAAVVLKQAALDAEALGRQAQARRLWGQLLRRFPQAPASADALYSLGRGQPRLRRQLLQRFPAHPAALAAALEASQGGEGPLPGALHLARWGPRWPGGEQQLRQACLQLGSRLSAAQRGQLAAGLSRIGAGEAALRCLGGGAAPALIPRLAAQLEAADQLALGQALLQGDAPQRALAATLLLQLVRQQPDSAAAAQAVQRLSELPQPELAARLRQLPARWRDSAPVAAVALRPSGGSNAISPDQRRAALALLQRWPAEAASWELQWDLARLDLLAGRWRQAEELLQAIAPSRLPAALAARQRFWLGYAQQRQGRSDEGRSQWRQLLRQHPGGYYGWRAAKRLGLDDLQPAAAPGDTGATAAAAAADPGEAAGWRPLASGDASLDQLWRLDQRSEAWESWRSQRRNRPPLTSQELLLEGRLRLGVGDEWTGLAQLEQAGLQLPADRCEQLDALEHARHPRLFLPLFQQQSQQLGVPLPLLLGLTKQESRFTPSVSSSVGAVGLMQLMPDTAAELAGTALPRASLEQPERNVALGSRYLHGLLNQWQGDPILAVASYNAGPGAAGSWNSPRLRQEPELWVEAIPYPETRLYVKKVLGNAWSYQQPRRPRC